MAGCDEAREQGSCKRRRLDEAAATWHDLPTEIVAIIFGALDDFDLVGVRRVCRLWCALADDLYRRPLRLAPSRSEYVVEMARRGDLCAVCRAWSESVQAGLLASDLCRIDGRDRRKYAHNGDHGDGDDGHRGDHANNGGNGAVRDHASCWDDDIDPCAVMRAAAESGNGALVQWLCDWRSCLPTKEAVRAVAEAGGQEAIRWLHARDHTRYRLADGSIVTATLAGMGHLRALDWLHARGDVVWDETACAAAAAAGRLDVLDWLRARDHPWDARTCVAAADAGHVDILWWAVAHGCPHADRDIVVGLVRNGLFDDIVRAAECGCPLSYLAWEEAADVCRPDILEWLLVQRCPTSPTAILNAAAKGCVNTMAWLRAHGASWHPYVFRHAAYKGHLDALKWAATNGCLQNALAMNEAACAGHLHVMEWLCDALGFSLDDSLAPAAALAGQYGVLVWLRDRGYRWDKNALTGVAAKGHLDTLLWAAEAGFAFDAHRCRDAIQHNTRSHRATKKWIEARILPPVRPRCRLLCPADARPYPLAQPMDVPWSMPAQDQL
ncbi:Ankyrin repeat domain containing protein [Pandoravirus dulcis]|uniref:Ankyrin repeat domain containing protein n=1 Tax=Pandoravirus dulcis TaxID=1349409 RepID=S4VYF4_9VIRU|nr:Ankyrin repeat domain containing protein [Pandoravirus dulcis]AGO83096.1 Ankyrin repeat domain containing protein [Pandoravirus dulcis]